MLHLYDCYSMYFLTSRDFLLNLLNINPGRFGYLACVSGPIKLSLRFLSKIGWKLKWVLRCFWRCQTRLIPNKHTFIIADIPKIQQYIQQRDYRRRCLFAVVVGTIFGLSKACMGRSSDMTNQLLCNVVSVLKEIKKFSKVYIDLTVFFNRRTRMIFTLCSNI